MSNKQKGYSLPALNTKNRVREGKSRGSKNVNNRQKTMDDICLYRIFTCKKRMKIRLNIHNNFALISILAVVIGVFLSYYELSQLFDSYVIVPNAVDYMIAISHLLFFTFLPGILIYICTRRHNRFENIKHFLYSVSVVIFFCIFAIIIIEPLIGKSNHEHAHIYEEYFKGKNKNTWEHWDRGKHSRYFHDDVEDWTNRSIFLFLLIFAISRVYNISHREEEMERKFEKLKNESLQSQINALNNQINPHFFFNALNALHSLIDENKKEQSIEYLSSLSNVFRYILRSEKKDIRTLQEEFDFLDTYRYMLQVKYEEKLQFNIQVDKKFYLYRIPVLSLLPLIENVTKHNEISNRFPMIVHIYMDEIEGNLKISNEKRTKLNRVESDGIGLENLNNRFKLQIKKEIKIEETTDTFSVSLPLLIPKE